MKKFTLLLLLAAGFQMAITAQCPVTPVLLTTQTQVNNFATTYPTCTYLNVRFEVKGAGITDLTPLNQLTGTSKNFYINFNPDLTTLTGLDNITEVLGDLTIQANHQLTNLQGFGSLSNAPALVKVENNDGLLSLEGLTAGGVLTHVGSLVIIENNSLTDLGDVYDALETVGEYVYIQDNAALTSINTFNNLVSVGQYLTIDNHPSLTAINGFAALETVGLQGAGWDFEILHCPQLTTVDNFTSLSQVGKNFEITDNTNLSTLSFPGLNTIGGGMSIAVNSSLTSLSGLGDFTLAGPLSIVSNTSLPQCEAAGICDYLEGPGAATISNNSTGCNSVIQVETACLLLPVELVHFKGNVVDGEVHLDWHTASEKDNDYFQVEHSIDGVNFEPLSIVNGMGTSTALNKYSFIHSRPFKGDNYYRLKQVDLDGTFSYSDMVRVETVQEVHVEIYPNPTTGYARLKGELPEGTVRLSDSKGRLIAEKHLPEQYVFDLTREPEGIYLIEIITQNERIVKRLMKH